jgi:hypothetical protein
MVESDRVIGQIAMMTNSSGAAPFWAGELALAVRLKRKGDSICTNILTARVTAEDDTNRGVADWIREAVKMFDSECKDKLIDGQY